MNSNEPFDLIKKLEERVKQLEQEVSLLKRQNHQEPSVLKVDVQTEVENNKKIKVEAPIVQPFEAPPEKKEPFDFEKQLGQVWLPRIFIGILLIGFLWGLKVGVDRGWVTSSVRVIIGYVATVLLGWLGYKQYLLQRRGLGLSMLGGMVALGMLATFASHELYHFITMWTAFVINMLIVGAGLFLSSKTRSETLLVFSSFGAFLVPFLLESTHPNTTLFTLYNVILFLSLYLLSFRFGFKYTFYIIYSFFQITLLAYSILELQKNDQWILVAGVFIQHLFIVYIYLKNKIMKNAFSETLLYTNFVLNALWMRFLVHSWNVYIYAIIAALYIVLAVYSYSRKRYNLFSIFTAISIFAVGIWVSAFSFHSSYVYAFVYLLNGTIGIWVALKFKSVRSIVTSSTVYVLDMIYILNNHITAFYSVNNLLWLSLILSMLFIISFLYRYAVKHFRIDSVIIDRSIVFTQVIAFYYIGTISFVGLSEMLLYPIIVQHVVSFILLAFVLGCGYFAYKWKHGSYLFYASVVEYLLLIASLIFMRLVSIGERQYFLISISMELIYVIALFYLLFILWKRKGVLQKITFVKNYMNVAVVAMFIVFAYINKWLFAISHQFHIPSDYLYFIHSFMLLLYAFITISIGKKFSWRIFRILGAILVVLTIIKLFVIDLENISLFIRAILFILVGITGTLYSRTYYKKS